MPSVIGVLADIPDVANDDGLHPALVEGGDKVTGLFVQGTKKAWTMASDVCACSSVEVSQRIMCFAFSHRSLCRTVRQNQTTTWLYRSPAARARASICSVRPILSLRTVYCLGSRVLTLIFISNQTPQGPRQRDTPALGELVEHGTLFIAQPQQNFLLSLSLRPIHIPIVYHMGIHEEENGLTPALKRGTCGLFMVRRSPEAEGAPDAGYHAGLTTARAALSEPEFR